MKSLSFACTLVAGCVLAASALRVEAATNSRERIAKYAQLQDWSGVWGLRSTGKLASDVPEQRKGKRDRPPYNPEWEAQYVKNLLLAEDQGLDGKAQLVNTHTLHCVAGFPRNIANGFDRWFVITPDIVYLMIGGEMRLVYTDGRPWPEEDVTWEKFQGWSMGKWEGDTLAIETRYTKPGMWGGQTPVLFSEKAVVFERLRMLDKDTIENQVTIVDPVAFTAPWKFARKYQRRKFTEWSDEKEICVDVGDRHPISGGKLGSELAPAPAPAAPK